MTEPTIEREPRIERQHTVIDEVPSRRDGLDNPFRREPLDDRGRWGERQSAPGLPDSGDVEADDRG
jgi:hypothetical protein